jgi:hypothetical protein
MCEAGCDETFVVFGVGGGGGDGGCGGDGCGDGGDVDADTYTNNNNHKNNNTILPQARGLPSGRTPSTARQRLGRARCKSNECVCLRCVTGVSVQFIYLAASSSLKGALSLGRTIVML